MPRPHGFRDPGVVEVNQSALFEDTKHTQGGVQHLAQFLWDEFTAYLHRESKRRKKKKLPTIDVEAALRKMPATAFLSWVAKYLKKHRVGQSFVVDENMGVQLTNLKTFVISPGVPIRGTMQDSGAIGVTHGRSQPGNDGMAKGDMTFGI